MRKVLGFFGILTVLFFYRQIIFGELVYCCDNFAINIPSKVFLVSQLKSGIFPLWNPYIFSGSPFLADLNLAVLYPLNIFYFFLDPFVSLTLIEILCFLIALTGTYVLARSWKISVYGSLVSAIIFGFSGTMVVYTNNLPMLQVASLLPWVGWAVGKYFRYPKLETLLIAVLLSELQIIAGHPQLTYLTWLFCFVIVIYRSGKHVAEITRPAIVLGVLVFLLSSVQVLPFLELVSHSLRTNSGYEYATFDSLPPLAFLRLFLPLAVGSLSQKFVIAQGGSVYGYIGVLPLLLLLTRTSKRPEATLLRIIIFSSLVLALGKYTPVFRLAYLALPGLRFFRSPAHFLLIYTLASALLCGYEIEEVFKGNTRRLKKLVKVGAIVFGVGALVFMGLTFGVEKVIRLSIFPFSGKLAFLSPRTWHRLSLLLVSNSLVNAVLVGLISYLLTKIKKNSQATDTETTQICSSIYPSNPLCCPFDAQSKPFGLQTRVRRVEKAVIALIFADLFLFSRMNLITVSNAAIQSALSKTKEISSLIEGTDWNKYRILTDQSSFPNPEAQGKPVIDIPGETKWQGEIIRPNINMIESIPTIDGYASTPLGSYLNYFGPSSDPTRVNLMTLTPELRRLMGVRYLVASWRSRTDLSGLTVKGYLTDRLVFEDKEALPRFFFQNEKGIETGGISISTYTPNKVDLTVQASQKSTLVFTDVLYPGWRAWIDGKIVPIIAYRTLFKSIAVDPGVHIVRFSFLPVSVIVGAIFSLFGIAIILGLGIVICIRRFIRKSVSGNFFAPD